MSLKHVGRIKKNQRKVVVAYRTVPNDPENCVIVASEALMAEEHDTLMKTVESGTGQSSYEFAEAMARTSLPDGRNMLAAFHTTGKLLKMKTSEIEMIPDRNTSVSLDVLNQQIAEQKGLTVEDLALKGLTSNSNKPSNETLPSDEPVEVPSEEVISDEDLAAKYRSDADRMYKEAKKLREEAEKLSPTKRKTKSSV